MSTGSDDLNYMDKINQSKLTDVSGDNSKRLLTKPSKFETNQSHMQSYKSIIDIRQSNLGSS
jgi:hypothetical protein